MKRFILMLGIVLLSLNVNAACSKKNISGQWLLYGTVSDSLGDYPSESVFCSIKVKNNGMVKPSSFCYSNTTGKVEIGGTKMRVKSSCVVSGKLSDEWKISLGSMTKDTQAISGYGRSLIDSAITVHFNMIKH